MPSSWLPDVPRVRALTPFDPFCVRPGSLDYRVLFQDRVWVTALAEVLPLEDMSDAHRENVVSFLLYRQEWIWECVAVDLCLAASEDLGGLTDALEFAAASKPPDPNWIESTPLMCALRSLKVH